MEKIYIESLGCAKNQVDSEILLTYALENGYERTESPAEADVIVVNTCAFIEDAKKESIDTVLSMREAYPKARIILSGCLAQRYGKEMEFEEVDAIFGNYDLSLFPEILKETEAEHRPVEVPSYPDPDRERDDRSILLSRPGCAYLKISEGCNHCCSYCAIPIIRGPLRSRPFEKIIEEAKRLIKEGVYEISVIAQDLGAYGIDLYGRSRFTELMDALSSLDGDFVLRMLYIHPDTFPMDLLPLVKERKRILPYFDIPVQHADPKILRAMGRTGSRQIYLSLVDKIRESLPDAVIRTTIMLGFPGEDEETFEEVKRFISEGRFDWMGSFTYSREEDTPAYKMRNKREHDKAHKAAQSYQKELMEMQNVISEERMHRFVGNTYKAIIEERIEGEDLYFGRIYAQAPDVDGLTVISAKDLKPGDVVDVKIIKSMGFDLDAVAL